MTVRCKLKLVEIAQVDWSKTARKFTFSAVYDDSIPEDRRFYDASSPNANFTILVNNPAVVASYELGKHYYFDSIPVQEQAKAA